MRATTLRERGFALLIVLWTLAVLSLLISQLAASGRQAVRLAGTLRQSAILQAQAEGAIQLVGFHAAASGAAHWPADGKLHEWRDGGILFRARLTSEAGKLNPSVASLELLTALIHGCGVDLRDASQIASAIVAWRFPSAQAGFGADTYREAGRNYAPPGQPFESLEELDLVLGMTSPLHACLAPELSLYRDTDPDPNAADPRMLRAIGEMLGSPPQLGDAPIDESVIAAGVAAVGPDGTSARRRAILRMEAPAPDQVGASSIPFRVLQIGG